MCFFILSCSLLLESVRATSTIGHCSQFNQLTVYTDVFTVKQSMPSSCDEPVTTAQKIVAIIASPLVFSTVTDAHFRTNLTGHETAAGGTLVSRTGVVWYLRGTFRRDVFVAGGPSRQPASVTGTPARRTPALMSFRES